MANPIGRDAAATLRKLVGEAVREGEETLVHTTGKAGPSSLAEQMRGVRGKLAKEPTEEALQLLRDRGVAIGPDTMKQVQTIALENPKASPQEVAQKYMGFAAPGRINVVEPKPTEALASPTTVAERLKQKPSEKPAAPQAPEAPEPARTPAAADEWAGYKDQETELDLTSEPTSLAPLARIPEVEAPSGAGGFAPSPEEMRKQIKPGSRITTKAGIAGTVLGVAATGALLMRDDSTGETTAVPPTDVVTPPPPSPAPAPSKPATLKAALAGPRTEEPKKEPTAAVTAAQQSFPNTISSLLADFQAADRATGGGQPVDRTTIKEAMDKLTQVDKEINTMYDGKPPPELADVSRARRDAFRAYKEQARVNDWLSIVDRAIGAIGQFASAQAAMGTPYVGNYKPSTIDYDAKTQQALREYQAEVGLLQQEREESEQARSRYFKEKDMTADQLYKKYQLGLEKAKLEVSEKEDIQNEANKRSKMFFDALQDGRQQNNKLMQAVQEYQQKEAKAAEKKTTDTQEDAFKAQGKLLELYGKQLENEVKKTEGLIEAATKLATKDTPENQAAFAAAYPTDITGEVSKKAKGWFTSEAGAKKEVLQGVAADAARRLQQLRDNLDRVQQQQVNLLQSQIPGTTPAPAAGQTPAGGGTVPKKTVLYPAGSIVEQNGKKYKVLKDYSAGDDTAGVFEETK